MSFSSPAWLVSAPLGLHLLNGGLLYGAARGVDLSPRVAICAALVYLTFFAHFEAVLAPRPVLQLLAISAALLSALFYLKIAQRRPPGVGRPQRKLLRVFLFALGGAVFWPFVTAVSSFLQPIQASLQMDAAQSKVLIASQGGVWSVGIAVLLAVHVWAVCRGEKRELLFFVVGVLFGSVCLLMGDARLPPVLPSRFLVLLSPFFAVLFAETVIHLVERVGRALGTRQWTRGVVLAGVFLALCLQNLLAIQVSLFRRKLTDGFSQYEGLKRVRPDKFTPLLQKGISEMISGREAEALDLLRRAAVARPFLLQYLLGSCRLSDLRWMTGSSGLRGWLRQMGEERASSARGLTPTDRRIFQGLRKEVSDYALCLFCISHLEQRAGHVEESHHWLSQVRFLERDPERLASWIGRFPEVRGGSPLSGFVVHLRDPVYLQDPLPWRVDDYGFGRFLMRLLAGWDVKSTWDQQVGFRI